MSHPLYNGGLQGALTDDLRPYLADDGNWSLQGTSEQPTHRSIYLLVNGLPTFGFYPTWISEPWEQALARPGCFERQPALDWRGPVLRPGDSWEIRVKAGVRYVGWGDSAGQDAMEWGSGDPRDTAAELLATTGLLVVSGDTPVPPDPGPQPPPVDDTIAELSEMVANVELEMGLATATDPEAWIRDNPGEANEILRIVVYPAHGQVWVPKQLATHRGRAASGIAQNGVTCQENL